MTKLTITQTSSLTGAKERGELVRTTGAMNHRKHSGNGLQKSQKSEPILIPNKFDILYTLYTHYIFTILSTTTMSKKYNTIDKKLKHLKFNCWWLSGWHSVKREGLSLHRLKVARLKTTAKKWDFVIIDDGYTLSVKN